MSGKSLLHKVNATDTIPTWTFKVALIVTVLTTTISALRVSYYKGYLTCSSSPEYLSALGILSLHGNYLAQLNLMHLEITICLLICAVGLWLRRPISFVLSLSALVWIGKIYLSWYLRTLQFMAEQEITDFALLQGPSKQHLIAIREGTWFDLVVLVLSIALSVWLVQRLVGAFLRLRMEPPLQEP